MKKYFALTVAVVALVALVRFSFAGQERYEAKSVAPAPPPECDWTGWYVGGHFGYDWATTTWTDTSDDLPGELVAHQTPNDIFGGLQLGYNRQVNDWFVLGFEISGSYSGIDDAVTINGGENANDQEPNTFRTKNDWIGTAALRAGFTGMHNHALFYGKVGAAVTHWDYHYTHNETFEEERPEFDRFHQDEVRTVPMFGLGIEYMFNCHWSAKVEYQHLFLGEESIMGTLVEDFEANEVSSYKQDLNHDSIQVGFNYHF